MKAIVIYLCLFFLSTGCGDTAFLEEAVNPPALSSSVTSGDIIVISGSASARTGSPFPLHLINLYSSDGTFKSQLAIGNSTERYFKGTVRGNYLYYTVDNADRIDRLDLTTLQSEIYVFSSFLSGNTIRAVDILSDGGFVIAEDGNTIEKFDSSLTRVTTNFPFDSPSNNINKIRSISGDRFAVMANDGTDRPRIYNNDGSFISQVGNIFGCASNCNPYDMLELDNGQFILSLSRNTGTASSLELLNSDFTYQGLLFRDTSKLVSPASIAKMKNGNYIVCDITNDSCSEFSIDTNGVTATFVKTLLFLREPSDVFVVP